mgnify:FL=1
MRGLSADLCVRGAMWAGKEGAVGNAGRRTQFWRRQVSGPGEAKSDLWQYIQFAKRFKVEDVWPEELIAKKPEYRGKTLYDVLYANGQVDKFPLADLEKANGHAWAGYMNDESKELGYYLQKGLFEEYATFGRGHAHDLAYFDVYHKARGLRWRAGWILQQHVGDALDHGERGAQFVAGIGEERLFARIRCEQSRLVGIDGARQPAQFVVASAGGQVRRLRLHRQRIRALGQLS